MFKSLTCAALAVLALGLAPQALKAGPLCPLGNATLHGTYVVYGTGTAIGVGSAVALGEHTYDGRGNAIATFTVNINGHVQTFTDVPSTYTVNSNCTGTAFEAGAHYSFVTSPDGNKLTWIETDSNSVFSGTEVRLNPVEDAEAQVHPSAGLPQSASQHAVTLQPASLRVKSAAATRKLYRR